MSSWPHPRYEVAYNRALNNLLKVGPFSIENVAQTSGVTATLSLYSIDGETTLVDAQDMDVSALPYASYNLDTSTVANFPADQGYKGIVTWTESGTDYVWNILVDVVRNPLVCTVVDADLARYVPSLTARLPSTQSSYASQIQAAFEEVQCALFSKGYRPALMFDPNAFRMPIIFRALAICCQTAWKKETNDRWQEDYEDFMDQYNAALDRALSGVFLRVDENEDGLLQANEEESLQPHRFVL